MDPGSLEVAGRLVKSAAPEPRSSAKTSVQSLLQSVCPTGLGLNPNLDVTCRFVFLRNNLLSYCI